MPLSSKNATCERWPTYVLEARRLCKVFGGGATQVTALWEVNLKLRRGEMLAIMGPSGSGKSTLLHLLGGIEPPTSGEVILEGATFGSLNNDQRSLIRRPDRLRFPEDQSPADPVCRRKRGVAVAHRRDAACGGVG